MLTLNTAHVSIVGAEGGHYYDERKGSFSQCGPDNTIGVATFAFALFFVGMLSVNTNALGNTQNSVDIVLSILVDTCKHVLVDRLPRILVIWGILNGSLQTAQINLSSNKKTQILFDPVRTVGGQGRHVFIGVLNLALLQHLVKSQK